MSFEDKVNNLIGQPYSDKNHCYALVMQLVPDAPKVEFLADGIYKSIKQIEHTQTEYNLKNVDNYKNKDIILLGNNEIYHHVGVYYEGGIVHSDIKNGVVYNSLEQLKKIYSSVKGLRV